MTRRPSCPSLIDAAIRETHARRRPRRHLAHRLLEREHAVAPSRNGDHARVKLPYARGCGRPSRRRAVAVERRAGVAADARPRETERGLDVAARSSCGRSPSRAPRPASTRSNAASAGSFPISCAISAMRLAVDTCAFSGLRAFASTTPSQPPAASMMFHQPGEPVCSSRLSRARISGSTQARTQRVVAAFERPARDRRLEPGAAGRVDIHVGRHVDAARARRLDGAAHRSPSACPSRAGTRP